MIDTDSHPVWTLCAETETLQPETDTSLTRAFFVRLLITFLWDARGDDVASAEDEDGGRERRDDEDDRVSVCLRG